MSIICRYLGGERRSNMKTERIFSILLSNKLIFFTVFISLGVLLRVYLASFAYKKLVFDMYEYHAYALKILGGENVIDCCLKNMGYPVVLAGIYALFGVGNLEVVRFVNILLEMSVAIILYIVGKNFFNKNVGTLAFILYVINPFTSSFTGLILAESATIFFLSILVYILSRPQFQKLPISWLLFGVLLGWIVFIKHSFYQFSLGIILAFFLFMFQGKKRILFLFISLIGFIIASTYSLIGNYRNYRQLSVVPPYSMQSGILYGMFYLERYREIPQDPPPHPEFTKMALEFDSEPIPKTEFNKKYTKLFWEKMSSDWPIYIKRVVSNTIRLWDKDHLYVYEDPFHPYDLWPLRIANFILLACFLFGIGNYLWIQKFNVFHEPLALFTIFLFIYMLLAYPIVSSESRHTIFFYSLLILWAAYGMHEIKLRLSKKT